MSGEKIYGLYTLVLAHIIGSSICQIVSVYPCGCLYNLYTYSGQCLDTCPTDYYKYDGNYSCIGTATCTSSNNYVYAEVGNNICMSKAECNAASNYVHSTSCLSTCPGGYIVNPDETECTTIPCKA